MRLNHFFSLATFIYACAIGLSGCGLQGPLYLPEPKTPLPSESNVESAIPPEADDATNAKETPNKKPAPTPLER